MTSLLTINASAHTWMIGCHQEPSVIGFPAGLYASNISALKNHGLKPGALFLAISRHWASRICEVIGDPYIDQTRIWADHLFPLRVPFRTVESLGGKWYRGRDTRDVLEPLFLGTLYRLYAAVLDCSIVKVSTLKPAFDLLKEREVPVL